MTCLNTIGAIALSVLTMLEAFPAQPTVKDSVMLFFLCDNNRRRSKWIKICLEY